MIRPAPRARTVWPDTTSVPAPVDHHYVSAVWLLGRHRQLADLVERLPGVVDTDDPDGTDDPDTGQGTDRQGAGAWLDLDLLAEAVAAFDAHRAAWQDYRAHTYEPPEETAWDRWQAAGPAWPPTPAGRAGRELARMSRTERVRLRLLACFAPDGARIGVGMFTGFDDAGLRLVDDWLEAIRHA